MSRTRKATSAKGVVVPNLLAAAAAAPVPPPTGSHVAAGRDEAVAHRQDSNSALCVTLQAHALRETLDQTKILPLQPQTRQSARLITIQSLAIITTESCSSTFCLHDMVGHSAMTNLPRVRAIFPTLRHLYRN
eukprot:CAMPEP_0173120228 /NCGR_PEP_ID=MMETSP1102-20130122/52348_1 /TAXON_ID=49646 /ORGANISM="Geminigera sp., Strain Caron Lab Isolate" /LENGTH=132 /DNA_ID=CAMNT_0014026169 /DNA_START=27 /DNA_END=424 /DNA_ORIENTATION=+